MNHFDINIYNHISDYYILYNKDKNLIVSHILIHIKNNHMRILYINHLDLYISNMEILKKSVEEIKNNINIYDIESNLVKIYINKMIE